MIRTHQTPCTLEFCPAYPRLGVCGFYETRQLASSAASRGVGGGVDAGKDDDDDDDGEVKDDSPPVVRAGGWTLFEVALVDQEGGGEQAVQYVPHQTQDGPAILDQQWTQDVNPPLLLTADADGRVSTYQLHLSPAPTLRLVGSVSCASPGAVGAMSLALDISDDKKRRAGTGRTVASTLSTGEAVVLAPGADGALAVCSRWSAHNFEAWTCAFDAWQPRTLLTGGDDCALKLWDTREPLLRPVSSNAQFGGGVTAIRSHTEREHEYAVGSYDGHVRLFDGRKMGTSVAKEAVDGGVWRIKPHPNRPDRLLLACMHAGFRVLDFFPSSPPALVSHVSHNAALAYGADWSVQHRSPAILAGCSFYDKAIHLWTLPS